MRYLVTPALLLCTAAFAQPSDTGPLAPPANGPRRGDITWTALSDCTLHASPGSTLTHATVIFKDGLIIGILPAERTDEAHATDHDAKGPIRAAAPPAGAKVINCTGLHVYPGFIDAYVEVDAPAPAGDASGRHWSPKVTPQRSALDGAGIDSGTAESLRKLGFTAAAISPRGGVFRGTSAVVSLAKPADDASAAKPPVYAEKAYQSVAFELGGGYPSSEMGAIAMIRQTLSDADWQSAARKAGQAIEPNAIDVLAPVWIRDDHMKAGGYNSISPLLFNTDDELEALRAGKVAREFNREFILLGSGIEYQRLNAIAELCREHDESDKAPEFQRSAHPRELSSSIILPLNFPRTPDVSSVGKAEGVELKDLMAWEQAPTNPRRLAAASINFSLTTSKLRDRSDFRNNLRSAIKHGLTEQQAIEALTIKPAQLLGVAGQLGTIEQGKRANIILADGPIFGDKTKLRAVYIDGQQHEITAAPVDMEGRWIISMPAPAADAPKQDRYLTIDKDNSITVHLGDKNVKATRATIDKERVSFAFDHEPLDGQKGVFIASAIVEYGGGAGLPTGGGSTVDPTPTKLSGTCIRANGDSFFWTAARQPANPMVGTWRVINADNKVFDPKAKEGLTIAITDSAVTLTFTKDKPKTEGTDAAPAPKPETPDKNNADKDSKETATGVKPKEEAKPAPKTPDEQPEEKDAAKTDDQPDQPDPDARPRGRGGRGGRAGPSNENEIVIRAEDVVFKDNTVTFTHDLVRIGGEGKSRDTITLDPHGPGKDDDTLNGTGTYTNDSKHTYEAIRSPHEGAEIAPGIWVTDEEKEKIKAIPEKLPTPFGPYGLEAQPPQQTVVLRHAILWTNGPNGILPDATIIVSNGKITGVGTTRDVDADTKAADGSAAIIIDATGKHITPGILDCHSHTGISRGVNEGAQAVTSEVRIADVTDPDDVNWYRQLAGGVTAINSLHGSANAIGGQSQTNKLRWGCANPDDMHFEGAMPGIKFALGENPRQVNGGGGGRGGAPQRYPASRMGVEQLIRDRFTAAQEYGTAWRSYAQSFDKTRQEMVATAQKVAPDGVPTEAQMKEMKSQNFPAIPRRDLELEALAEVLAGKRLVHCHSYRQDEILMLCNVAKDFNFKIGTLQHALEAYKVGDYALKYTDGASGFADWWAYKIEVQDAIPGCFPILHDIGLTVSYNSDSNELARRLNVDAAKAVKYGSVTAEEALKFVTINPAKQLRVDNRVGSLEAGKDADIVIWSGDPLSAFSKAEATYVDGRCLFSLEQDAKHRDKIKSERQRLIQKLLAEGRAGGGEGGSRTGGFRGGPRPTGAADAATDPAAPAGGRGRRRPPEDSAALYSYYLDLFTAKAPNETPGDCGITETIQFETDTNANTTTDTSSANFHH